MKVFISCDIEGISGVVSSGIHTMPDSRDYDRARSLMTGELNAAVEGALNAGAKEIIVNDSHGPMINLLIEKINPAAKLITGSPKPLSMMQGIDRDFAAAIFVGYHARMGAPGVLSHTYSGARVSNIWVNDILVGETGINAGLAGYFGVPVVLVCGDDVVCREAKELLPHVRTASVKTAIARQSALCLPPDAVQALIRKETEKALLALDSARPWLPDSPVTFKVEFKDSGMAENAALMPYSKRVDEKTVAFSADDYLTAFKGLLAMITLAG